MLSPSFTTKPKRGVTKNNLNFYEIKASLTWNIQRQNREEGDAGRREMKCRCIHFQGFRNKSQTRGLKTTEIIILPQFRRLDTWNQGVGKISSFWKESLSPFSLLSSGGRQALGGPQPAMYHSDLWLYLHVAFFLCVSSLGLLMRTPVIQLGFILF